MDTGTTNTNRNDDNNNTNSSNNDTAGGGRALNVADMAPSSLSSSGVGDRQSRDVRQRGRVHRMPALAGGDGTSVDDDDDGDGDEDGYDYGAQ
ncbi:hypothetical protein PTSG_11863 [Salpingoeca rosetta]|uniref:Uncharacterized protein n=1 Tax=Salpingoeca rosetta (strain ATCC 50818 / BSB-021) TaxID=946362 RepID=F2U1Q8_SALR5|nr:uncharacterized protein PTSG_11863 [Salpingoeca rosetta]EGD81560.1 hypothetical protein PTSG_11863 [Salpingoeca rosetta]|eukprot:XP_004996764.1 hypothetical protein PTSG_11863 [Salpingoeca rosetta]